MPHHIKGIILSLLAFLSFAITDASRKYLSIDYGVISTVFWAALACVIIVLVLSIINGGIKKNLYAKNMKPRLIRGLVISINSFMGISAFYLLPMADAYIIIFTAPIIIVLLSSIFYGENISRYKVAAILLGITGSLLVIKPGLSEWNVGYLLAFGCAVFFAMGSLLIKEIGNEGGTLSHSFYPQIISVFLASLYMEFNVDIPEYNDIPIILIAGLSLIVGTSLIAWAFAKIQASEAMLYHYSQIIWGVLFGYIIFSDIADIYSIGGALLVFSSGYMIYLGRKKNL